MPLSYPIRSSGPCEADGRSRSTSDLVRAVIRVTSSLSGQAMIDGDTTEADDGTPTTTSSLDQETEAREAA